MPPKVSVIVPNYNHARFLRQRLDSIFNQTFQDFEVIILDDCSTENSKEVIEEYRNRSQVSHVVYNETNSGSPFKQWAKGIDLAQGEYIWIAESDDWAEVNFLEIMVSCINSNRNIALVFSASNWVYLDHEDKILLHSKIFKMNGIEFIKKRMICGNSIQNASAVIFRKII
jgi:glycosyltransferase involved in cell wall biosynthesis